MALYNFVLLLLLSREIHTRQRRCPVSATFRCHRHFVVRTRYVNWERQTAVHTRHDHCHKTTVHLAEHHLVKNETVAC